MLNEIKRILSLHIISSGCLKFDEKGYTFNLHKKFPDAPRCPYYIDLRPAFRNRIIRNMIAGIMLPFVVQLNPRWLIDLPQASTPLTTTLADLAGIKDILSIRSEALKDLEKDHGIKSPIIGNYDQHGFGLVVDDTVSSLAYTKIKAISILQGACIQLFPFVCVVVDREEGGKEILYITRGYELKSILGLHSDIVRYGVEASLIPEDIRQKMADFADTAKSYALSKI